MCSAAMPKKLLCGILEGKKYWKVFKTVLASAWTHLWPSMAELQVHWLLHPFSDMFNRFGIEYLDQKTPNLLVSLPLTTMPKGGLSCCLTAPLFQPQWTQWARFACHTTGDLWLVGPGNLQANHTMIRRMSPLTACSPLGLDRPHSIFSTYMVCKLCLI